MDLRDFKIGTMLLGLDIPWQSICVDGDNHFIFYMDTVNVPYIEMIEAKLNLAGYYGTKYSSEKHTGGWSTFVSVFKK